MENAPVKKRFIESSSFYKNCDNTDPFSSMNIDDSSFLDEVPSRSNCHKCNRSRKYYCYTCYIPVKEISGRIPIVDLPVKIDIIKHPKEVDGKSTSTHAAVLAPRDVTIYTYPDFPSYENEQVLLIFPGKSAVSFQDWWKAIYQSPPDKSTHEMKSSNDETINSGSVLSNDEDCNSPRAFIEKSCDEFTLRSFASGTKSMPFTRIIFIDSTWRQSKALYSDDRLRKLPCIVLASYKSLFWRYYRGKQETHLSTIEAVYYFLVELHGLLNPDVPYSGQYDNILFFFKFMYFKIRTLYDPLKLKAYRSINNEEQSTVD